MTPEQLELLEQMRIRRRQLIAEKNWQGALEVINVSISIQATFDRYYNKGIVLLQLKDVNQAIESFEKALELNPNFTQGKAALQKAKQMQIEIETKKYTIENLANEDEAYENVQTVDLKQQETVDLKNHSNRAPMVIVGDEDDADYSPNQLPPPPEIMSNIKKTAKPVYLQETIDDPLAEEKNYHLNKNEQHKSKRKNTDIYNFLNPDEM